MRPVLLVGVLLVGPPGISFAQDPAPDAATLTLADRVVKDCTWRDGYAEWMNCEPYGVWRRLESSTERVVAVLSLLRRDDAPHRFLAAERLASWGTVGPAIDTILSTLDRERDEAVTGELVRSLSYRTVEPSRLPRVEKLLLSDAIPITTRVRLLERLWSPNLPKEADAQLAALDARILTSKHGELREIIVGRLACDEAGRYLGDKSDRIVIQAAGRILHAPLTRRSGHPGDDCSAGLDRKMVRAVKARGRVRMAGMEDIVRAMSVACQFKGAGSSASVELARWIRAGLKPPSTAKPPRTKAMDELAAAKLEHRVQGLDSVIETCGMAP